MSKQASKKNDGVILKEKSDQSNLQVRWDGSNMKSTYANVCNVTSTREEMTLIFGTNQAWHTGQSELVVELTNRVILNPFAAKRSVILSIAGFIY